MELDNHKFTGMSRDLHPINQKAEFLWEAHNIRLTNRDSSTLLSVTNEKGNTNTNIPFIGQYVGHCVIDEYLVLFTLEESINNSYIYRISKDQAGQYQWIVLFSGYIFTNLEPIQTLGYKESDNIVKVYWVSRSQSPKMINIKKPELLEMPIVSGNWYDSVYKGENNFSFVPELKLEEQVTVERNVGDGAFSPGTIQYAFAYYYKYGAHSNIFYTTPIYNISHNERGGGENQIIGNTFTMTISNVDNFDYLRIYSIHRTSKDTTPSVKIVADIEIETPNTTIQYTDNGQSQELVDPTILLYLGGSTIFADCINNFENTLFFGNINTERRNVKEICYEHEEGPLESIESYIGDIDSITGSFRKVVVPINYKTSYYTYGNQLQYNTSTFKSNEWYRVGLQFQHKDGSWSEPFYVGEYTNTNKSSYTEEDGNHIYNLPTFKLPLAKQASQALSKNGYKKVRGIIVPPSFQTRKVLAQGILCPTVFTIGDRLRNNPFAQSSWFFRPYYTGYEGSDSKYASMGTSISYTHLSGTAGWGSRKSEIYGTKGEKFANANSKAYESKYLSSSPDFYIDQSILTFHSPDVEFDTITDIEGFKYSLYLTSLASLSSTAGDIDITTSSPPILSMSSEGSVPMSALGFQHITTLSSGKDAFRRLVSGLFYKDTLVFKRDKTEEDTTTTEYFWEGLSTSFLVAPWHKSGSLNNDETRPASSGAQSAVMQKKIISNLLYFDNNINISDQDVKFDLEDITIFNSDEVTMSKIPSQQGARQDSYTYFGNVDTLLNSSAYSYVGRVQDFDSAQLITVKEYATINHPHKKDQVVNQVNSPVRMKYKSTPHIVINLNSNKPKDESIILPYINSSGKCNVKVNPFWLDYVSLDADVWPNGYYTYNVKAIFAPEDGTEEIPESDIYAKLSSVNIQQGDYAIQLIQHNNITIGLLYVAKDSNNDINTWEEVKLSQDEVYNNITYGYYIRSITDSAYNNTTVYKPIYSANSYNGRNYYLVKDSEFFWSGETGNHSIKQQLVSTNSQPGNTFMFIADIIRSEDDIKNPFGGNSDYEIQNNLWIPAGDPQNLDNDNTIQVEFKYGDTWYQRYDCLKTYPFTNEDENQVIEIASFMCETRVNIDGRYDRNRGQKSNLHMSPQNFNVLNKVYTQKDSFFNYRILDDDYYNNNRFPTQILWSKEKSNAEIVDSWTQILPSSNIDLDGKYGEVTSIQPYQEYIFVFQNNAISKVNFKSRVQIPTSDGVPIEIQNSYKVDGYNVITIGAGCQDVSSIINTKGGIYFLDNYRKQLYMFNGKLSNLSTSLGMDQWLRENINDAKWVPYSIENNGTKLLFDNNNNDLYISPGPQPNQKDALCFSEKIQNFTSIMSYGGILALSELKDSVISLKQVDSKLSLWEQFTGDYNSFYGEYKPYSISFISNKDALKSKIFDTVEYQADLYDHNKNLLYDSPFNYIQVENEYQDTGIRTVEDVSNKWNPKKKFRIWRGQIPRDNNKERPRVKTRIMNPWVKITLGNNIPNRNKMEFHNVYVKYTV